MSLISNVSRLTAADLQQQVVWRGSLAGRNFYVEIINMNITNSGTRTLTLTGFEILFVNQRGEIAPVEVPPKQNHFHEMVGEYPFPITLAVGEQVSLTFSEHLASPLMLGEYGARIRLHDSEGRFYTKYSTRSFNPRWGSYSKYSFIK